MEMIDPFEKIRYNWYPDEVLEAADFMMGAMVAVEPFVENKADKGSDPPGACFSKPPDPPPCDESLFSQWYDGELGPKLDPKYPIKYDNPDQRTWGLDERDPENWEGGIIPPDPPQADPQAIKEGGIVSIEGTPYRMEGIPTGDPYIKAFKFNPPKLPGGPEIKIISSFSTFVEEDEQLPSLTDEDRELMKRPWPRLEDPEDFWRDYFYGYHCDELDGKHRYIEVD